MLDRRRLRARDGAARRLAQVPTATGALVVHQQAFAQSISGFGCSLYGGGFASDGIVSSVLTRLTPAGAAVVARARDAVLPVDVATNPAETIVVVASATQGVWAKTPSTVTLTKVFQWSAPTLDQVTAVGVRSTELDGFVRDPARLLRFSSGTPTGTVLGSVTLDLTTVRSTGHEIFHANTNNLLACASCCEEVRRLEVGVQAPRQDRSRPPRRATGMARPGSSSPDCSRRCPGLRCPRQPPRGRFRRPQR